MYDQTWKHLKRPAHRRPQNQMATNSCSKSQKGLISAPGYQERAQLVIDFSWGQTARIDWAGADRFIAKRRLYYWLPQSLAVNRLNEVGSTACRPVEGGGCKKLYRNP